MKMHEIKKERARKHLLINLQTKKIKIWLSSSHSKDKQTISFVIRKQMIRPNYDCIIIIIFLCRTCVVGVSEIKPPIYIYSFLASSITMKIFLTKKSQRKEQYHFQYQLLMVELDHEKQTPNQRQKGMPAQGYSQSHKLPIDWKKV